MYGLRTINNHYPAGCRGDWIVVGHPEYKAGRSKAMPFIAASQGGRPCKPATKFAGRGPRPISAGSDRLKRMTQGLPEPKPPQALSKCASDPATRCLSLRDAMALQHQLPARTPLNGHGILEKFGEEELMGQTKAQNRPQSAVHRKEQTSAIPDKKSERPTSAPAGPRQRMKMEPPRPKIEAARVLPRTAAQAREALQELRTTLGLDSKKTPHYQNHLEFFD